MRSTVIARGRPRKGVRLLHPQLHRPFQQERLQARNEPAAGIPGRSRGGVPRLGGYDEVLSGYAAGGDTDLEDRLILAGLKATSLGDGIIDDVVEHDNVARFTFHREPIDISYAAGLLYRRAKMALLRGRKRACRWRTGAHLCRRPKGRGDAARPRRECRQDATQYRRRPDRNAASAGLRAGRMHRCRSPSRSYFRTRSTLRHGLIRAQSDCRGAELPENLGGRSGCRTNA